MRDEQDNCDENEFMPVSRYNSRVHACFRVSTQE